MISRQRKRPKADFCPTGNAVVMELVWCAIACPLAVGSGFCLDAVIMVCHFSPAWSTAITRNFHVEFVPD